MKFFKLFLHCEMKLLCDNSHSKQCFYNIYTYLFTFYQVLIHKFWIHKSSAPLIMTESHWSVKRSRDKAERHALNFDDISSRISDSSLLHKDFLCETTVE